MNSQRLSARQLQEQRLIRQGEAAHHTTVLLINRTASLLQTVVKTCGWMFGIWCAFKTAEALAGQSTQAFFGINLDFLANRHFATSIGWLVGLSGVGYGLKQRSLHNKISNSLKRMSVLEGKLDPNRSGSGLDDGWKSNPHDV